MKRAKIATVCLIAIAMTVSGVSGMVLCLGDDGHIAIEVVHREPCSYPGEVPTGGSGCITRIAETVAGDCVDVSISSDKALRFTKDVRHDRLLKHAGSRDLTTGPAALAFADCRKTQRLAHGAPPGPAYALLAQRTIVLRI
ncbi:MAG: hypothetical protein O2923_04510 [Verrucomicrobia bacterium]|nr:hypothetical protein [Verrucomicrobiota bacterium]MDA1085712.1 hypothetical protein [Verrucomicrobiota bacterium]